MININPILKTDSYKFTHPLQYPDGTSEVFSYIESRGCDNPDYNGTIFFGAQIFAKDLAQITITKEMVDEAAEFVSNHIGPNIFPYDGWMRVVNVHQGKIPLEIKAATEGEFIPFLNAMVTVRSTDNALPWMVSWFETALLRAIWYPVNVATISNSIKKVILGYLRKTSEESTVNGQINFKLHDFGARGVSSGESAGIGSAAHLANFMGSDSVEGVLYANHYYGSDMAGFSIPAAEHSTVTTYGKLREADAYRSMLNKFTTPLVAVVSDSYDLMNAVENIWGKELKQEVIDSGKIVVIRPDSGDPATIVTQTLIGLNNAFGSTTNSKGYKVLNNVRVIQGDGINQTSIEEILERATEAGFATDNIAFGMGGALLQQHNRDTFKFAMKCSLARINGNWVPVFKDPATDHGKRSKSGLLDLIKVDEEYKTVDRLNASYYEYPSELKTIYYNGKNFHETNLNEIRSIIDARLAQES